MRVPADVALDAGSPGPHGRGGPDRGARRRACRGRSAARRRRGRPGRRTGMLGKRCTTGRAAATKTIERGDALQQANAAVVLDSDDGAGRARPSLRRSRRPRFRVHHGHGELAEVLAGLRSARAGFRLGRGRRHGTAGDATARARTRVGNDGEAVRAEPARDLHQHAARFARRLPRRHFEPDGDGFLYRLVVEYDPRSGSAVCSTACCSRVGSGARSKARSRL